MAVCATKILVSRMHQLSDLPRLSHVKRNQSHVITRPPLGRATTTTWTAETSWPVFARPSALGRRKRRGACGCAARRSEPASRARDLAAFRNGRTTRRTHRSVIISFQLGLSFAFVRHRRLIWSCGAEQYMTPVLSYPYKGPGSKNIEKGVPLSVTA